MTVLLANRRLSVRRRAPGGRGPHGDTVVGALGPLTGPWPGRAEEAADVPAGQVGGRTWELGVDVAAWPLAPQDIVVDADSGQEWLITSADLLVNNADPAVDYVLVRAHLRRDTTGTRP
uniref:hypothetical protein n=1 Tax=Nonomuraea sp. CA-251285 TaxID=3240002 RepID=UPI003F4961BB